MQTSLHSLFKNTEQGKEADAILRSCVHCGFCTATCPTYLELGDERDGPRGRIYLIKQFLEQGEATEKTRVHLDRCLTCRSCETTCPSDVQYGRLLDITRGEMEQQLGRSWFQTMVRKALRLTLPYPARFGALLRVGQLFRPILPASLKNKIPARVNAPANVNVGRPLTAEHSRSMLVLGGCAQSVATPNTNAAAARVLDRLGITLREVPEVKCCGAVSYHLGAHEEGLNFMRRNIDAWWPAITAGAEAIVTSASGCGATVVDYGELLASDPDYADKAKTISSMTKDLSEVLLGEDLESLKISSDDQATAFQCPCTLQHALKLPDSVQAVLTKVGINLVDTKDKHLCCGSAGTYSILQPALSKKLLTNKLSALMVNNPKRIVTANVGCQLQLASKSSVPVLHWIELLDS